MVPARCARSWPDATGWKGNIGDRTITAGDVGLLRFEFEQNVAFTGYDITINFVGGESVTFIS